MCSCSANGTWGVGPTGNHWELQHIEVLVVRNTAVYPIAVGVPATVHGLSNVNTQVTLTCGGPMQSGFWIV